MKTGLRRLHYFMLLSDRLNFRRAAEELAITQPALSRAIAQLESDLGIALFERDNRRVTLTEAGKVFREGCGEALDTIEVAVKRAQKTASGHAGSLVIGYTDIAIAGCLAEIVQSFRGRHPDVAVTLQQAFTEAQFELLRNDSIDVGFVTGPVRNRTFESVLVQKDGFVAVLPSHHRLAARGSLTLPDLAEEPFVLGSEDKWRVFHDQLYQICRSAGFKPRVVQRAPDTQGIVGLVACGMGISIQTEALKVIGDERVRLLPLEGCDQYVETHATWNPTKGHLAASVFMDHVRESDGTLLDGHPVPPSSRLPDGICVG